MLNPTTPITPVPLAIVGIGCLFPKAESIGYYWANVKHGVDTISDVPATHWNPDDYFDADPKKPDMTYARRGGFLSAVDFNPMEFGIAPRDLEAIDTTQLLSLVAAKQALSDAGVVFASSPDASDGINRERVSVILGVTGTLELVIPLGARLGHPKWRRALKDAGVADNVASDVVGRIAESYVPWQENSFPGLLGNVVAGRIANRLDLHGTNCVVDAACASSLSAVHLASLELATGKADVVVTGGADTFNDIFMYMCFSKTPALSPTGDSKPFDASGDGTILGEGIGLVVLKRLEDAERDGDRVYAVIRGVGSSSDGKGNAIYAPSSEGQVRCLRDAYTRAGVAPDTVELIEAHGTGTKVGDAAEATGLATVFAGTPPARVAIGSVKSQIGHTKAAAGVAALIKAALALHNKVLPPTLKVTAPVEPLRVADSPFYVNTRMRPWLPRAEHPRRAGVSAFGFGGSNFHAVLEEHQPRKSEPDWDGRVEILAIAAESVAEVASKLDALGEAPAWPAFARAAAASRDTFTASADCRLLLVAERDATDLKKLLASTRAALANPAMKQHWQTPEGAFFGRGLASGMLTVVFPGQGSQTVGMLRELTCLFPEMLDSLAAADATFAASDSSNRRLSDMIYPPTSFADTAATDQEIVLRSTDVAQPALGAVSFGAWLTLAERFGVRADAFAGHSYGELPALAAAGRIGVDDLFQLSCLRGRLMAGMKDAGGDPGSMLVVFAASGEIEKVLQEDKLAVVIANKNSPGQTVVSGGSAEIARAAEVFRARKVRTAAIPVAAAFHSSLVAAAAKPFRAALEKVNIRPPVVPVYANTTAEEYPEDAGAFRDLLGHQLARPVEFVAEILGLVEAGMRTFLEVGPGNVLTRLIEAIVVDAGYSDVTAFAISPGGSKKSGTLELAHALARLAACGHNLDFTAWERESRCRPAAVPTKPTLIVPICGANWVQPRPARPPVTTAERQTRALPTPNIQRDGTRSMTDPTPSDLTQALQLTTQTLAALQRMQEETARLHKLFLERQEEAQRTLHSLIAQQQSLLFPGGPSAVPFAPVHPIPAPTPNLQLTVPPQPLLTATLPAQPLPDSSTPVPPLASTAGLAQMAQMLGDVGNKTQHVASKPTPHLATQRIVAPTARVVAEPTDQDSAWLDVTRAPAEAPYAAAQRTPVVMQSGDSAIATILLAVVSEKTGYPVEMLTLDMALDSDLGVDSIKRVEILSALQDRLPGAPTVKPEHLGTLHTLRDVEKFLSAGSSSSTVVVDAKSLPPQKTAATGNGSLRAADAAPPSRPMSIPAREAFPDLISPYGEPPVTIASPVTIESVFGSPGSRTQPPDVAAVLLAVVSEKTGYPVEMLTLDMALDSDLGVDSIKRVEILSALQDRLPGAPTVKPEHLGTLHTLRDVALFLSGSMNLGKAPPTVVSKSASTVADAKAGTQTVSLDSVPIANSAAPNSTLLPKSGSVSELAPKTEPVSSIRMPNLQDSALQVKPAPRPTADIDFSMTSTGTRSSASMSGLGGVDRSILQAVDIDLTSPRAKLKLPEGGEIWIVCQDDRLSQQLVEQLRTMRLSPKIFPWAEPNTAEDGQPVGLVLIAPVRTAAGLPLNRLAFRWLQHAGPRLRLAARTGSALFATVAKLDGTFGLTDILPNADPTSGGLAGLVKTARFEWPELAYKAIDLSPAYIDADTTAAAAAVAEELLTAGPLEVGISAAHRCTPELVRTARKATSTNLSFGPKDVILLTGGARGVTVEVAAVLAESFRSTIVMVGRTQPPGGAEPAWLASAADEAAMKKAIAENLGPTATPKTVADAYHRLSAQREIRQTLARIEQAGSRVYYFTADVTNPRQIADVLHQVQVKIGPVTALVHGAGVLADKRIEDLTPEQFDSVYHTKVDGLRNILDMLGGQELQAIVIFSSTTARFGRVGQAAYAVANEVLNKTAQVEARKRPNSRVVAINWGPWEGGMVTPALRKVFETEGIGLIPLSDGGVFAVQELNMGGRTAEVVALGKLRPIAKPGSAVISASTTNRAPAAAFPSAIAASVGTNPSPSEYGPTFERSLELSTHPVLRSHVIDGRAVLPMSLHMEWLAHAALHGNPGLLFHGFNEMRVTNGVMVEEGQTTVIRAVAARAIKLDKEKVYHVPVELRGKRRDGRDVIHSRAEVVLVGALPKAPLAPPQPNVQPYPHPLDEIYRYFLFHGPELHGIERVEGVSEHAFVGSVYPAPTPAEWFLEPLRGAWVADPLVLDASFQMMILWSYAQHGAGSLPCFAGRYRQYRRAYSSNPVRVNIRITRDNGSFARADIDYLDMLDGSVIAQIQDYECVIDPQLNQAFRRNQLVPRQKQQN